MMSEETERKEAREELTPQGIVAAYLVEMNEYRSDLYSTLKMGSLTPQAVLNFIRSFRKFFDMTAVVVSDAGLKEEINKWFEGINASAVSNTNYMKKGIDLSIMYQDEVSGSGIFAFFTEPIVPPFLVTQEFFTKDDFIIGKEEEIEEK
jgi:hypothetical protein